MFDDQIHCNVTMRNKSREKKEKRRRKRNATEVSLRIGEKNSKKHSRTVRDSARLLSTSCGA